MNLRQYAEKLQQDLLFAAPELHTQKIYDLLQAVVLEERETCARVAYRIGIPPADDPDMVSRTIRSRT